MSLLKSRAYEGRVSHQRLRPRKHRLSYRVFSFLIDLDELPVMDQKLKLFSRNRFNLFSFWDKDYGLGQKAPLGDYVRETLARGGLTDVDGPVRLLCYPRIFGYAFNPLSVYYCYSRTDVLRAIIYEVSNTFGERHSYLIAVDPASKKAIRHSCEKELYVSPFMDMDASYHFRITPPCDAVTVFIDQHDAAGSMLKASFSGRARDLTDKSLAQLFMKYPLMSIKVIVGIHWEALNLWRKGLKIFDRPRPPEHPVTFVNTSPQETKS